MTPKQTEKILYIKLNKNSAIALFSLFTILFLSTWIIINLLSRQISADDAIRWTLWLTALAILTTTAFSLIQARSEFQQRRSDEDKEQALKYQYLEQQIFKIISDLETHKKVWGHDGVYEILGRVVQIESDHKALLFILQNSGIIKKEFRSQSSEFSMNSERKSG